MGSMPVGPAPIGMQSVPQQPVEAQMMQQPVGSQPVAGSMPMGSVGQSVPVQPVGMQVGPQQPVVGQPAMGQPGSVSAPGQTVGAGSAAGKKKVGLIIGIVAAALVVVGGVLAFVLLVLPNLGGGLSCTLERTTSGIVTNEKFDFKFEDGVLSTTDYRVVMTADPESTIFSKTVEEIFDIYSEEYIDNGLSKISLKREGDSVVSEAKGLAKSELSTYTGLSIISIGDVQREDLKNMLAEDGLICQ